MRQFCSKLGNMDSTDGQIKTWKYITLHPTGQKKLNLITTVRKIRNFKSTLRISEADVVTDI